MLKIHQYPKCSTCKKALNWLRDHGVEHQSIDITQKPPSAAELKRALQVSGLPLAKLFNTSGQSYREGDYKERLKTMTQAEALSALSKDGKLIKRPFILGDEWALIGFNEAEFEKRLGRG
jgi:arsenate reductase